MAGSKRARTMPDATAYALWMALPIDDYRAAQVRANLDHVHRLGDIVDKAIFHPHDHDGRPLGWHGTTSATASTLPTS